MKARADARRSKADPESAELLKEYYPAEPGRTYVYRNEFPSRKKGTFTRTVMNVQRRGNKLVVEWEEREDGPGVGRKWKAERSWRGVLDGKTWVVRTPLREGTRWDGAQGSFEIASLDDGADVPAGRFDECLVVARKAGENEGALIFAKGVGLVRALMAGEDMAFGYALVSVKAGKRGA